MSFANSSSLTMSGESSRRKGHDFERDLVRWFKSHGIDAERGYQYRGGGAEQADVILDGLPWYVEAKRRAKSAVYKYIEKAQRDCDADGRGFTPVVFLKADRKPILAVMFAADWLSEVFNK